MCDCIEKVNKLLEEHNTELDIPITFTFEKRVSMNSNRTRIQTRKLDKSKRIQPKTLIATYCPFCGESYDNKQEENNHAPQETTD